MRSLLEADLEEDKHGVARKVDNVAVVLVDQRDLQREYRVHHEVQLFRRLPRRKIIQNKLQLE